MKKLLLFIFVLAGLNIFGQHSIPTSTTTPTQLTAGNGTVVVKSGSVVVTSGTLTTTSGTTALAMTSSTANTSGTVTAGAKSVTFETSSDFVGTIDGVTANANMVYPLSAGWNNTLPQIVYTVSAGSIRIRKLQ